MTALAAAAVTSSMPVLSAHAATITHAATGRVAAPAHAAAPATATATSSLDNTDPIATGCWDANAYVAAGPTPITYPTGRGYVRNWYSPDCGTNWSEVYTADGSSQNLTVYVYRQSDYYNTPVFYLYGNDAYSNQVYAPNAVACAVGTINGDGAIPCA
jgi:hypothetical protein